VLRASWESSRDRVWKSGARRPSNHRAGRVIIRSDHRRSFHDRSSKNPRLLRWWLFPRGRCTRHCTRRRMEKAGNKIVIKKFSYIFTYRLEMKRSFLALNNYFIRVILNSYFYNIFIIRRRKRHVFVSLKYFYKV